MMADSSSKTTSNTLSRRVNLSAEVPLKVPLMVYIETSNRCNFNCSWCPTGHPSVSGVRPSGNMTIAMFGKILADLKELTAVAGRKIKQIGLYWMGEPFMNKNILEFVRLTKQSGVTEKVHLTTNGSLISKENSREIINSGLDLLVVSIYGMTDKSYLNVHQRFTLSNITENLSILKNEREALDPKTDTPSIVAKVFSNPQEAESLLVHKLKCVDSIAVESPFNWSDEYVRMSGEFIAVEDPGLIAHCPSPWFVMSVNWCGQVGVCCADWANIINVGDFAVESALEIWTGDKLQAFKKTVASMDFINNPACKGCTYYAVPHDAESNIDGLMQSDLVRACSKPLY